MSPSSIAVSNMTAKSVPWNPVQGVGGQRGVFILNIDLDVSKLGVRKISPLLWRSNRSPLGFNSTKYIIMEV